MKIYLRLKIEESKLSKSLFRKAVVTKTEAQSQCRKQHGRIYHYSHLNPISFTLFIFNGSYLWSDTEINIIVLMLTRAALAANKARLQPY